MVGTQELVQNQDTGLTDLLKFFSTQQASGTQTNTTSASPGATANSNALLASVTGGTNADLLQQMAAAIIDQANQKVAPAIGESIGAGNRAYSDTTLQDTAARARAYAAQAISKNQLDFIDSSNKTAANIVNGQMQSSKVTTTKTATTPLGTAMNAAALGLGAYSLAKKAPKIAANVASGVDSLKELLGMGDPTNASSIGEAVSPSIAGSSAGADAVASLANSEAFAAGGGITDAFVSALDTSVPEALSSVAAPEAMASALDFGTTGTIEGLAADGLGGIAPAAATDVAATSTIYGADTAYTYSGLGLGADSILSGVGADATYGTIGSLAADGLGGFAIDAGLVGTGAAVAEGAGLFETAATLAAGWVICTELRKQGLLTEEEYLAGATKAAKMNPITLRGYQYWAIPFTQWMRKNQKVVDFITPYAKARNQHLLGKKNFLGWLSVTLGESICWAIGVFVEKKDYRILYAKIEG